MRTILATSVLALAIMGSPALAYSNVSPKQQSTHSFSEGREIKAPRWSFACVNDQGAQQCDQPEWAYGSPDYLGHFKKAF